MLLISALSSRSVNADQCESCKSCRSTQPQTVWICLSAGGSSLLLFSGWMRMKTSPWISSTAPWSGTRKTGWVFSGLCSIFQSDLNSCMRAECHILSPEEVLRKEILSGYLFVDSTVSFLNIQCSGIVAWKNLEWFQFTLLCSAEWKSPEPWFYYSANCFKPTTSAEVIRWIW